jgi:hypothetical protein
VPAKETVIAFQSAPLRISRRALFSFLSDNVKHIALLATINITHPPTPLTDPAKAGSLSGSWEPEPRLGFAKTIVCKLF